MGNYFLVEKDTGEVYSPYKEAIDEVGKQLDTIMDDLENRISTAYIKAAKEIMNEYN